MNMKQLGQAVINADRVLALRPREETPMKAIEIVFDGGEKVIVADPDPLAAIQAYAAGLAAPRST